MSNKKGATACKQKAPKRMFNQSIEQIKEDVNIDIETMMILIVSAMLVLWMINVIKGVV